ncbi:MAG: hypothetical protein EOP42_07635 [Sphingobacteriaceae bacterium]|nr:MAG: hypothetical protein EOP42_07635 [Sphingobacteriaceae bacterium]
MLSLGFSFEDIIQLLQNSKNYYLVKIDMQGNYVYLNDHFIDRNSAYYDHDTIKPASTALPAEDQVLSYATFLKCIASPDECFSTTLRKLDGKGGYIVTFWEYKTTRLITGEIDGIVGIGYDITAFESHKEYIGFLTSTLNQVANQQSHLVRRPLANIIGLVEILDEFGEADENLKNIVTMLRKSCDELNDEFEAFLIKDISGNNGKAVG